MALRSAMSGLRKPKNTTLGYVIDLLAALRRQASRKSHLLNALDEFPGSAFLQDLEFAVDQEFVDGCGDTDLWADGELFDLRLVSL